MEEFTIKELQEDLNYLQYYLENVINDVNKIYGYYLENFRYLETYVKLKEINIIISKHINKNEFEFYLSILKKYKKRVFDFETSYWYENDLETANVEYTENVIRPYFINFYISYLELKLLTP